MSDEQVLTLIPDLLSHKGLMVKFDSIQVLKRLDVHVYNKPVPARGEFNLECPIGVDRGHAILSAIGVWNGSFDRVLPIRKRVAKKE